MNDHRFERWLAEAGHRVPVRRFPEGTRTAEDAARAIGCEVGQIFRHGVRGLDLPHAAKKRDQLTVYASSRELENTPAGQKASL